MCVQGSCHALSLPAEDNNVVAIRDSTHMLNRVGRLSEGWDMRKRKRNGTLTRRVSLLLKIIDGAVRAGRCRRHAATTLPYDQGNGPLLYLR